MAAGFYLPIRTHEWIWATTRCVYSYNKYVRTNTHMRSCVSREVGLHIVCSCLSCYVWTSTTLVQNQNVESTESWKDSWRIQVWDSAIQLSEISNLHPKCWNLKPRGWWDWSDGCDIPSWDSLPMGDALEWLLNLDLNIWGFHEWYPKMDGISWKILFKWMIWGYPYFRKPPYIFFWKSQWLRGFLVPCKPGSFQKHHVGTMWKEVRGDKVMFLAILKF